MLARVAIVASAGGTAELTYAIPAALEGRVEPGHRVLVPIRSRRVTGIVVETGENLASGGAQPRPLLEVLEARPLFDRAHLALMEFLSSYYMAPLAEAYRSVIPGVARVESQQTFKLGDTPGALALAAMTPLERSVIAALGKRAMTLRQLARLGPRKELAAALARLAVDSLVERHDGTHGRHRDGTLQLVRFGAGAESHKLRGRKQRAIMQRLAQGTGKLRLDEIEAELPGATVTLRAMAQRGIVEIVAAAAVADPLAPYPRSVCDETANGENANSDIDQQNGIDTTASQPFELSWEQSAAIEAAIPAIRERRFQTFLLWGVTASGKTEVYLQLAREVLKAGRQVLVLVPEIALADQVVREFRARFGPLVGIVHSAQNVAERWGGWMGALSGQARIMIGPRSVVFAPIHGLGLIVVDEEHDPAYKQEEGIRYNARDLAVALGQFSECPVVLGSATPSAESFTNARRGRYRQLRLSRRVNERELAQVEIIDLREHFARARASNKSSVEGGADGDTSVGAVPLSPPLVDALRENLAAGGQSVVFLNRRGYHNFLQCHLCGSVIACANCSVSMTFHLRDRTLRCHYCGASSAAPEKCPECGGLGLAGQGFGTERLVYALAELMPAARIERMDSDTSGRKGARGALVDALRRGEIDVLVGTQMVTKGFDLPGVTLVGVVLADLALNMPDFRSAERTFQLLTQVAGRAGRGERPGRVLIQTYAPHHYSIRAARDQDYARFMRRELDLRRELMYPPFARMALVRIEGQEPSSVSTLAARVAALLGRFTKPEAMRVLGPAPAPIERIKNRYRWQVVVKAQVLADLRTALATMRGEIAPLAERDDVRLGIDIDPINML